MAEPVLRTVSMDPQGMDNIVFVGDNEVESGVGNGLIDLTTETVLPKTANCPEDYAIHNYRRPSMLQLPYRIAITVDSAFKKFGELKALDGVNMNVQEGTIYGLLGSSGCGKTTLLSCIVGLRQLDSGQILIGGKPPGSPGSGVPGRLIGYMPQDIALNGEFTIREVCHFFGCLYGMTKENIDNRVDNLVNLLDLKQSKKAIKNMSGGQKRRASFLVALLHEPEILILDEPTVGVDPVLRSNIWNHLRELVDKVGTTVIITTHYIEEMRQADTVGIMRSGILMTEGSPQELMRSHNATMLEDVVLHYCLKTEDPYDIARPTTVSRRRASRVAIEEIDMTNHSARLKNTNGAVNAANYSSAVNGFAIPTPQSTRPRRPPKIPYMDNLASEGIQTHSLNRIRALTLKNFLVIMRSIGFLFFIFACPALLVSIYCYSIGSPPAELGFGVVMEDGSKCILGAKEPLKCEPKNLACQFVNALEATNAFTLQFYNTEEDALVAVNKSKSWGYVHFGTNFSQHIFDRTLGQMTDNDTVEGAKIRVHLDMSTITTGQIIQKLIFETYRGFSTSLLLSCKVDLTGRDLPISIEKPIYGDPANLKYRNYLAPGMTTGFISFMSTLTCGLAYIVEKKDGMIHRTKVAGVTTLEIMVSHFVPQFLIMTVQTVTAFVIMFVCFDIPHEGSVVLSIAVLLYYGIAGIGLGFTAATLFDDEKNAMLCAVGIMLPNFVVSGIIFPLDNFPVPLRKIALLVPGTLPSESLRSVLLRGWGLSFYSVYMGFVSSTIFIILYAILTFAVLKIRK